MNHVKTYVRVFVEFDKDGRMIPRYIKWEDDKLYRIDRVISCRPGFSAKAGGQGDRYTICVLGKETNLFFERNGSLNGNNIGAWFVERKC